MIRLITGPSRSGLLSFINIIDGITILNNIFIQTFSLPGFGLVLFSELVAGVASASFACLCRFPLFPEVLIWESLATVR